MANIINFDRYFDDQDTSGRAETKFNFIQQIAILHLKLVLAVHRRALICYRGKTTKITPKNQFFPICAQAMCPNYFFCLPMNSADHCRHFEELTVAIAQRTRKS